MKLQPLYYCFYGFSSEWQLEDILPFTGLHRAMPTNLLLLLQDSRSATLAVCQVYAGIVLLKACSEGGVAPSRSWLSAFILASAAIYQPRINITSVVNYHTFARIVQHPVSKCGHVPSFVIENYGKLCDFWKRIQVKKHYRRTPKIRSQIICSIGSTECTYSTTRGG